MKKHTRAAALAALLVTALALSACQNLPRRTAGARFPVVGEHAQDGTWVLKCGTNKRWTRLMTIADANNAVADWLRSQAPTTTTTPPAPPAPAAPPVTTFTTVTKAGIANATNHIAPGPYYTVVPAGSACMIEVFGAPSRRVRGGSSGPLYMNLFAGMTVSTAGPCTWTQGAPAPQTMPATGDGMYRTGVEIQPGLYTAPGGAECYWETSTNADGSFESVTDIYLGVGPQLAEIAAGDAYFTSDGCGTWTPLPTMPARYAEVVSHPDNWILQGLRAFYRDGDVGVTSNAGSTRITTPSFILTVAGVNGGPLANGTFDAARSPAAGEMRLDVTAPGRGCNIIEGTVGIEELVSDGSGGVASMHLVAIADCEGKPMGFNVRF